MAPLAHRHLALHPAEMTTGYHCSDNRKVASEDQFYLWCNLTGQHIYHYMGTLQIPMVTNSALPFLPRHCLANVIARSSVRNIWHMFYHIICLLVCVSVCHLSCHVCQCAISCYKYTYISTNPYPAIDGDRHVVLLIDNHAPSGSQGTILNMISKGKPTG